MPTLAVLNNITTADGYTAGNTTTVDRGTFATDASITVTGAAVFMQTQEVAISGGILSVRGWNPEEFIPPKMLEISEAFLNAIRFRSAVPGTPAQVTCTLNG